MTTKNLVSHQMAYRLLGLLEERILSGNREQILGYTAMADMINWPNGAKAGLAACKANSVLDYACFYSGLPLLASHYVRRPDGTLSEDAFLGEWQQFRAEALAVAATHEWTRDEFARVRVNLCGLEPKDGTVFWDETRERGAEFIRKNLHRRVKETA